MVIKKKRQIQTKQQEVWSDIFSSLDNLNPKKGKTINEISKETKHHPNTIETNIKAIELAQDYEKKIRLIKAGRQKVVITSDSNASYGISFLLMKILKKIEILGKRN